MLWGKFDRSEIQPAELRNTNPAQRHSCTIYWPHTANRVNTDTPSPRELPWIKAFGTYNVCVGIIKFIRPISATNTQSNHKNKECHMWNRVAWQRMSVISDGFWLDTLSSAVGSSRGRKWRKFEQWQRSVFCKQERGKVACNDANKHTASTL